MHCRIFDFDIQMVLDNHMPSYMLSAFFLYLVQGYVGTHKEYLFPFLRIPISSTIVSLSFGLAMSGYSFVRLSSFV